MPPDLAVDDLWGYNRVEPKPFVHPLRLPSGQTISCDGPPSHAWHHGLWFAVKNVNGMNFWEEIDEFGSQRTVAEGSGGGVADELEWIDPRADEAVLAESRRLDAHALGSDAYAIDWTIGLRAEVPVTLDREPYNGLWGGYSGLAFRGRPDFTDTRLLLPDGPADRERIEGVPAPWIDLAGDVDGAQGGVAMFDAPGNPRHPVPWYASTRGAIYGNEWGNFVNAAFLWSEPMQMEAGTTLEFRYRVIVHTDIWEADRVAAEFEHYRDSLEP